MALALAGLVLLAVLMVIAAFWFRGRGDTAAAPSTTSTTEAPAPVALYPDGPTDLVDSIPVGFAQTEPGAIAAVMAWSPFYGRTEDPSVAYQLLETVWSPETVDVERDAEERSRDRALADYADRGETENLTLQNTPVAYRVEDYSDDEAEVSVWNVIIVSQEPDRGPTALWRTVTWHLIWDGEAEDWRVYTIETDSGPTPGLSYADEDDLLETTPRLDGFTYWTPSRSEDEPGWPVVRVPEDGETAPPEDPPDGEPEGER